MTRKQPFFYLERDNGNGGGLIGFPIRSRCAALGMGWGYFFALHLLSPVLSLCCKILIDLFKNISLISFRKRRKIKIH
jgi:hypothetical protein